MLMISLLHQSLLTVIAAFSASRVVNEAFHRPSDGKTTSPHTPSWSRSSIRLPRSKAPGARIDDSMNSSWALLGSFRRNDLPSTCTVSHSPSASFTERGIRSAYFCGTLARQRSSGSMTCESLEFVQIRSTVGPLDGRPPGPFSAGGDPGAPLIVATPGLFGNDVLK